MNGTWHPVGVFLRITIAFLILCFPIAAKPTTPTEIAREIIAPLLDPVHVATLKGERAANPRLYKVMYWLETARKAGGDVSDVIDQAQEAAHYKGTVGGIADKLAITWSRNRLEEYGCFTEEGMAKLRKGGSPEITKGEHTGDKIGMDHVLPKSLVPELEVRFYNLEPLPSKVNMAKSADITEREVKLARRWHQMGLLTAKGLQAVIEAGKQ